MQATKKLVLLDEFDREYKLLQKPAAAVAKTDHSLRLSNTLRDSSLTDDCKVKRYVEELHRYLNVDKQVATQQSTPKINCLSEPRQESKKKRKKASRHATHALQGTNIDDLSLILTQKAVFQACAICSVTAVVPSVT